jgi:hypothetical protein
MIETVLQLDRPTRDGLIFPTGEIRAALKKPVPTFVVLDCPSKQAVNISLDNVVARVDRLTIWHGELVATITILPSMPCGRIVDSLLAEKVKLHYHAACYGNVHGESKIVSNVTISAIYVTSPNIPIFYDFPYAEDRRFRIGC